MGGGYMGDETKDAFDEYMEEIGMEISIQGKSVSYREWPQILKDKLRKRIDDAFDNNA